MFLNKLASTLIQTPQNSAEVAKRLFQGISQENIFEGKIEQVLSNDKAIVSTDKGRFVAQINTKVLEGESILFEGKFNKDSIILKILDRTFAENKDNLLRISNFLEQVSGNVMQSSKDNQVNDILKLIFNMNTDLKNMSDTNKNNLSADFVKLFTNIFKHPDEILSTLIKKINSHYLQKNKQSAFLSDKKLKQLLSMFLASGAKNYLSSLCDNPVYSYYIPLFWQNEKTEIYITLFGENNKRQKGPEKGINAVIQIALSEKRIVSFSVHLLKGKVSYHIYSNDKSFNDFLKDHQLTLNKNINETGLEIESESINTFKDEKGFIKEEIINKLSSKRVRVVA